MDLESLSIRREPLAESTIRAMFLTIRDEIRVRFETKKAKERAEEVEQAVKQDIEPPEPKPLDPPVSITINHVNDVLFELESLPYFWDVDDPAQINVDLDRLRTTMMPLQFPKEMMDAAVADLEVGSWALFFDLSFEKAKTVYPTFQALNMSNDFVIQTRRMELSREDLPIETIFHLLRENGVTPQAKVKLYKFLLQRLGTVPLEGIQVPEEPVSVPKDLLESVLDMDFLIDMEILTPGTEPTERPTFPYLTKFERIRLIGQRATEISKNAPLQTDPGELIDPLEIAEKELKEQAIPLSVCRKFPDGSTQIWCIGALAKQRDAFYQELKEILDALSLEALYDIAIDHGYGSDVKEMFRTFLQESGVEPPPKEVAFLDKEEQHAFVQTVVRFLQGVSEEDLKAPLHILRLLVPHLKTDPLLHRLLAKDFASNFFDQFKNVRWVNIPGNPQTNPDDVPRYLTKEEIDDIVSIVPQIFSAARQHGESARASLIDRMRVELQTLELCPSALPELKNLIRLNFVKSRIDPGSAVGITAADALGEQVSQMTLNSVVGDTKLLICASGETKLLAIGPWVDGLMKEHPDEVTYYPKNRTEYLLLKEKIGVPTVSEDGNVFWSDVTAVTRHLPGGDLVNIKTNSGKEATATQAKSFLIWEASTEKLVQTEGSRIQVGDWVPIIRNLPEIKGNTFGPVNTCKIHNDVVLDQIVQIERITPKNEGTYVYDLTVPSTTNFCLANGLGVADTFHSAGSNKNMSSGIEALSELIYARKNRKDSNCTVFFKERLSFDELLDKEASIVETTIADLYDDWVVYNPEELDRTIVPKKFRELELPALKAYIEENEIELPGRKKKKYSKEDYLQALAVHEYWWYEYFDLSSLKRKPTKVLRLFLDPIRMVERKVTMKDVVLALQQGQGKEGIPSSSLFIVHSPTFEGIVDIYPNPEFIKDPVMKLEKELKKGGLEKTSYRAEFSIDVFIDNIILANLRNIRIRGVAMIQEMYPIKSPVWKIVAKERRATLKEKEEWDLETESTYWVLDFDLNVLSIDAITPEYLYEFLEVLGYQIVYPTKKYVVIRYLPPEEGPSSSEVKTIENQKPSDVRTSKIEEAKQQRKDRGETPLSKQRLDLENYHYLTTRGSFFIGLTEKEEVDSFHTYCNNIHLIALKIGVEAARQFFIKELYDTFTTYGGYVNPRNILLLADFLFSQGSFLGTNYTGMSAGTTGYLSLATFERSLQTLEKGAVFGAEESLEGVSAAIAVGKPVRIGTGFFDVISTPVQDVIVDVATREEELISEDLSRRLEDAFASGTCPYDLGGTFDPVAARNEFRNKPAAPKRIPVPTKEPVRGPEEEVPQTVTCPTPLIAEGPSDMLEEAMEKTLVGPELEELTEQEWEVRQIAIPSDIEQEPLTIRPVPGESSLPAPFLVEFEKEELEPLAVVEIEEVEEEERIQFTKLPVITP